MMRSVVKFVINALGDGVFRLVNGVSSSWAKRMWEWWEKQTRSRPRIFRRLRSRRTVRLVNGSTIDCDTSDYILSRLLVYEEWESHVSEVMVRVLSQGDVFLDVGAHVGYFSLTASSLVGSSGMVIAVEASQPTYARLLRNIAKSNVRNIVPINCAAGLQAGLAFISEVEEGNSGSASVRGEQTVGTRVLIEALDQVIPPEISDRIKLVKMDIEGFELFALKGMLRILSTDRPPVVVCEINPRFLDDVGAKPADVIDVMRQCGYRLFVSPSEGAGLSGWRELNIIETNVDCCFVPKWVDPGDLGFVSHSSRDVVCASV